MFLWYSTRATRSIKSGKFWLKLVPFILTPLCGGWLLLSSSEWYSTKPRKNPRLLLILFISISLRFKLLRFILLLRALLHSNNSFFHLWVAFRFFDCWKISNWFRYGISFLLFLAFDIFCAENSKVVCVCSWFHHWRKWNSGSKFTIQFTWLSCSGFACCMLNVRVTSDNAR